ncbi:MAG TPA: DUF6733 family protein [Saprospiraceae bacterium]|nr:DUF6733 family protein [Saprospiraceae bacterium]
MTQRNILTTFMLLLFVGTSSIYAQETSEDDKLSVGLSLNHDAFFGFNPMMTFSYSLNDKDAFTAYGIQWGAGTASTWGQWTEFGIGYNKTVGNFDLNPQIGFTFGSLLSSGAAEEGIVGDGIVPNLTINYGSDLLEGQFYFGYYAALSDNTQEGGSTNNYVHYWANIGIKATSFLSFGAHFEELYLSGGQTNSGGELDRIDGYIWLGPYVQLQKKGTGLRLSTGGNLADEEERFAPNGFYKLSFFVSF